MCKNWMHFDKEDVNHFQKVNSQTHPQTMCENGIKPGLIWINSGFRFSFGR